VTDDEKKARAILDALTLEGTTGLSLAALAQIIADEFATLEKTRDRYEEQLDNYLARDATEARARDGYHAFATTCDWQFPDGETMPVWLDLDQTTRDAFVAFAKAIVKG